MRHLRKLKAGGRLGLGGSGERFRQGYTYCAGEISRFVTSPAAGLDVTVSARLLHHLSACIRNLETISLPQSPPPLISPLELPPTSILNQSKIEALRFSLGHSQPAYLPALVPSDREDDKAWRPW